MKPIEVALLFTGSPTLALEHFSESLNGRLQFLGIQFEKSSTGSDHHAAFSAPGMELIIDVKSQALPAQSFLGALDSPLSRPFRGVLSDILFRHNRHMVLSIIPELAENSDQPMLDRLTLLQVAHAATTLLTEWHMPAAVHWRQSNQILVGAQYLKLAKDAAPWALFAHARITSEAGDDVLLRKEGIRLDEAIELIGRPIVFHPVHWPLEDVHASALSFLRYAIENGSPIPDGHTYGPEDGHSVKVTYVEPTADIPFGRFDLSAVAVPEGAFISQRAAADRPDGIPVDPENAYIPEDTVETPHPEERVRSLAISFMMLLVMPPIGLLLLVSNALFGVNPWRTGVLATASVALALVVGAFTFLSYVGQETAVFIDPQPIEATVLTE